MTYVFYLDRYHLGDPLFLTGFARDVQSLGAPCLAVHGAGEAAERAVEARGQTARWEGGILVAETAVERALVARSARDLNRQIAHGLNDAGVPAVALEAGGRGLLSRTETGLRLGRADWLREIVRRGAVPVVAALVGDGRGGAEEIPGGAVAGALACAMSTGAEAAAVMFIVRSGSLGGLGGDFGQGGVRLEDVPEGAFPEPEAVRAALRAGAEVYAVGRSGLRQKPLGGRRVLLDDHRESP